MRFYLAFVLFLALPLLNACSKKGDNNPAAIVGINGGLVSIPPGQYAVIGIININPNCGTTVANVTLLSSYGGVAPGSQQVGSGGSFNFPVSGGMNYTLQVTAGMCSICGTVPALTNGQPLYQVCLGPTGTCPYGYGYSSGSCNGGGYYPYMAKAGGSESGTILVPLAPNGGDFLFGSNRLYISPKKSGAFKVSLQYTSGNSGLTAVPALIDSSWSGTVSTGGSMKVAEQAFDHLTYGSQVDAGLLSYDQAFCGATSDAGDKMAAYAKSSGFSDRAVNDFKAAWALEDKPESVCVYPQDAKTADAVVALKSDSKMDVNRLWFAVVPSGDVAGKKFTPAEKIAKLVGKAKIQTLAALKKIPLNRKIASDNEFLGEELGYGLLIQK